MKVSIITATYNSASTVRDTIESVLAQTYSDIEYIIVDGASKDNTLDIANEYNDRIATIISEPDKGIYDAMNKGIRAATGDVIGILNSDDFFTSDDVIEKIVKVFISDKNIDGVYTNLYYVKQDDPSVIVRHWVSNDYKKGSFFKGWHPPHPTLYIKRNIYEEFGSFNLGFKLAADFELMLRFFEKNKIKTQYLNETTVRMRLGGATSKNLSNIRKGNMECIQAFKVNGLEVSPFYSFYRLLPKLIQFIK